MLFRSAVLKLTVLLVRLLSHVFCPHNRTVSFHVSSFVLFRGLGRLQYYGRPVVAVTLFNFYVFSSLYTFVLTVPGRNICNFVLSP